MRSTRSRWRRPMISSQSRHSARTVRRKRSAIAFAFGARTGVLTIRMLSLRKTFAEGAAVLAVAVTEQEADALVRGIVAEVARLLGDPAAGRILCVAGKPDVPARMRDEEQHV